MSESKITTKAIDNILNSSAKISKFKITPNYKIKSSTGSEIQKYEDMLGKIQ